MFVILNLILICFLSVILVAPIASMTVRWLISFLFSLFIVLQISSFYIGGSLIDYKFYVHFNIRDMMAMKDFFLIQIALLVLALPIFAFLIFWLAKKVVNLVFYSKKIYRYGIIITSTVIMSFQDGAFANIVDISKILTAEDLNFEKGLMDLGMKDYVSLDNIKAEKGKNIIIISLESFEKGFLNDTKAHLTPNMRALAKKWNYLDMKQTPGSNWTVGSLYTYLTGIPAFFKGDGNNYFQKSHSSQIVSIGNVLNKAGYNMTYLTGDALFSGTEDLLNTFQISDVVDARALKAKYDTYPSIGVHDKDLFEEAQIQALSKMETDKPFALFVSTISTHNPDGVYDKRMEGIVKQQGTQLDFMVSAVDNMVGNFMNFLETKGILSNTVVYIFPDHLMMGDASRFNNTGERGLYLMTNAAKDDLNIDTSKMVCQIDLPKIILNGANIKNNAKFLADYISGDKNKFIENNISGITALNNAGLKREGIWTNELFIEFNDSGNVVVRFDEKSIKINSDTLDKYTASIFFSDELRFIRTDYHRQGWPQIEDNEFSLNIYLKEGNLFAYLQKGSKIPILKTHNKEISFSVKDIKNLANIPKRPKQEFFLYNFNNPIEVNGLSDRDYVDNFINVPYNIKEGFLELEYSTSGETKPFVIVFSQPYEASKIAIHNELPLSSQKKTIQIPINQIIESPALIFRNWSKNGKFIIHSYKIIGNGKAIDVRFSKKTIHREEYIADKNRFIAHAGGEVRRKRYTNSLQALNQSYDNGFRLFELDIIKTLDGKYVAAHDWEYWALIAGYQGILPVTEKEFLSYKIHGEFTPMNMEIINKWFEAHPDAKLITDKVNEPKRFAKEFIDKKRLMMELFSINALKEGIEIGIGSAMASENVLNEIGGQERIKVLKSLGIAHIVVSRTFIEGNMPFLEELKANQIKTYVFHINVEEGKDEDYLLNYEMDYIFGMYADKWIFK